MRGATGLHTRNGDYAPISIHAPHAGSDTRPHKLPTAARISIHAPHAGSDQSQPEGIQAHRDFNPRSPCGERRKKNIGILQLFKFQSTLPMRGATWGKVTIVGSDGDFNPRSPCGERRGFPLPKLSPILFQSTLPMRGATRTAQKGRGNTDFNPRSPCGERHNRFHTPL